MSATITSRGPLLVIAHRGDSAHHPENTLASFVAALELGATVIEMDVQLTRDGHVVILHDAALDRTTTGRGRVDEMDLADLRRLSAGFPTRFGDRYADERVPTLTEALALLRGRARVLVEIKGDSVTTEAASGIEARTIAEVRRLEMSEEVALISFDHRALIRCRDLAPEIVRGHLFHDADVDAMLARSADAGCRIVMPEKRAISKAVAERVGAAGLLLATWVVDDPAELPALVELGLYGVGSNRPGVLIEALADGAIGLPATG